MTRNWRRLALAAVLVMTAGSVSAQQSGSPTTNRNPYLSRPSGQDQTTETTPTLWDALFTQHPTRSGDNRCNGECVARQDEIRVTYSRETHGRLVMARLVELVKHLRQQEVGGSEESESGTLRPSEYGGHRWIHGNSNGCGECADLNARDMRMRELAETATRARMAETAPSCACGEKCCCSKPPACQCGEKCGCKKEEPTRCLEGRSRTGLMQPLSQPCRETARTVHAIPPDGLIRVGVDFSEAAVAAGRAGVKRHSVTVEGIEASANGIIYLDRDGTRLLLIGDVELLIDRDNHPARVLVDRAILNVKDGTYEVLPCHFENFSFYDQTRFIY